MRGIIQPKISKGSQRWLQELVNHNADFLSDTLRSPLGLNQDATITWHSPLERDDYAEYLDEAFLERLSVYLDKRSLPSFWPHRGPQWDALGKSSRGDILLVEAKARSTELISNCGACQHSLAKIQQSLAEAGRFFGAASTAAWSQRYYQYANRLAHLYLLRQLNNVPAWLIFLYFVNAKDVSGPASAQAWRSAIEAVHAHLGITTAQLSPYVINIFVDVTALAKERKELDQLTAHASMSNR